MFGTQVAECSSMRMPRVDLAACLGGKLGVRTDADRHDQNIEVDFAAALEMRLCRLERATESPSRNFTPLLSMCF